MQLFHNAEAPLHVRTILFVILVCTTILGLDAMEIWTARQTRLELAKTETANLARSLAQHAQDVFEDTDTTIRALRATFMEDGSSPAEVTSLERRMRTRVANQQVVQRLFIYDAGGNWVASSLAPSAFAAVREQNYVDRDYFRYHRDHPRDTVLIGPPIRTKYNGTWVITVTRRINRPDGSFGGVIGASVTLDLFQRFFQTFDIGAHGAIALTTSQGILMVRRPFEEANVGRSIAQSEFFRFVRNDVNTDSFELQSSLDGTYRLGSFHRVSDFDLMMIVALDTSEVLNSWRRETKVHVVWTILIVLIIGLIGYQITIQIRYRAIAEAQLTAAQQTLERRVAERTADLQQTVAQRDLLLREVYHRVNNNMQSVNALLAMEANHLATAEARQPLLDMGARVCTLGLAHQQLMTSVDLETFDVAPFLSELADKVLARIKGVAVSVDAISLMVNLDFAVPLGLVVGEIVASCHSRASPAGGGRVTVSLGRNETNQIVLTISAEGLAPAPASKDELNTKVRREWLITGMARQIDGILVTNDENGGHWEIIFANPQALQSQNCPTPSL